MDKAQLLKALEDVPDDTEIWLAADAEGTNQHLLSMVSAEDDIVLLWPA